MTLRYPKEIGEGAAPDYVEFVPTRYRSNIDELRNVPPGESGAQAVILYMPNSTPGVGNSQQWGDVSFVGPMGAAVRDIGTGLAQTVTAGDSQAMIEDFKSQFSKLTSSAGDAAPDILKQGALDLIGGAVNASPSQLLALARRQVYNPNVELLYKMPGLRDFNFSFSFVPKNPTEAQQVNRVIKNFKKWSAPKIIEGGMFEVPHVWQVRYMTGGKPNPFMNKFKKAACVGVTVQANPQTTMHVAHDDGMPIETVMTLNFKEVNIITRKDHDEEGNQGY
jgi:hypothetical protein